MQFQVPQFIETEDKIIGPLTLKQFLYFVAVGGISFILFFFLKTVIWLILTIFMAVFAAALAFIKINGRPLPKVLIAALFFYMKPRLFLWQRETKPAAEAPAEEGTALGNLWQKLNTSTAPISKREKTLSRPSMVTRAKGKEGFETLRKITGEKEEAKRVDFR
ncbi:MAG: PrgI family protein [bacterium]|nr:PrgI family protein [bacterium]